MAFDESVKAKVRQYYVFDRLTLEQSAQKAGVAFGTARRWRIQSAEKGDDWDKARDVQIMAGGEISNISQGLLAGFIVQYRSTMEEIQTNGDLSAKDKVLFLSALADSFTKMTAASKKILPDVSEQEVALRTVKLLGEYIQAQHSDLTVHFVDALDGFAQVLSSEFKK